MFTLGEDGPHPHTARSDPAWRSRCRPPRCKLKGAMTTHRAHRWWASTRQELLKLVAEIDAVLEARERQGAGW